MTLETADLLMKLVENFFKQKQLFGFYLNVVISIDMDFYRTRIIGINIVRTHIT